MSTITELKRVVAELNKDIESIQSIDIPIIPAPLLSPISKQTDMLYKKSLEIVMTEAKSVWDREKVQYSQ